MASVLKLRAAGQDSEVRVNEDPSVISATLAVAAKESQPFVVFTNADTGKEESFQPGRVISFATE